MTPRCYNCRQRPARKGSRFCTVRCAAEYVEELLEGYDDEWCSVCQDWTDIDRSEGGCKPCNERTARFAEKLRREARR